jgi:hypothetical protein
MKTENIKKTVNKIMFTELHHMRKTSVNVNNHVKSKDIPLIVCSVPPTAVFSLELVQNTVAPPQGRCCGMCCSL